MVLITWAKNYFFISLTFFQKQGLRKASLSQWNLGCCLLVLLKLDVGRSKHFLQLCG